MWKSMETRDYRRTQIFFFDRRPLSTSLGAAAVKFWLWDCEIVRLCEIVCKCVSVNVDELIIFIAISISSLPKICTDMQLRKMGSLSPHMTHISSTPHFMGGCIFGRWRYLKRIRIGKICLPLSINPIEDWGLLGESQGTNQARQKLYERDVRSGSTAACPREYFVCNGLLAFAIVPSKSRTKAT